MVDLIDKVTSNDGEELDVLRVSLYVKGTSVFEVVLDESSIPGTQLAYDGLLESPASALVDEILRWKT